LFNLRINNESGDVAFEKEVDYIGSRLFLVITYQRGYFRIYINNEVSCLSGYNLDINMSILRYDKLRQNSRGLE